MGQLSREARALQNPAFGAVLLWSFAAEYVENHPTHDHPPLPITFLVIPMVLHEGTKKVILSTQGASGLRFFSDKFSTSEIAQSDAIATLQRRISMTRELTLESLQFLLRSGMVTIDIEAASVIPSKARGFGQQIPDSIDDAVKAAKKLGRWTSSLSIYEIASTLRLAF